MQGCGMLLLVAAVVGVLLWGSSASALQVSEAGRGSLPQMPFYHRFSPQVRENAEKSGAEWSFPALNTPEYHQLLVHRDLVRHGRRLATAAPPSSLTFLLGNVTTISSDGLHYVLVNVGTPSVSYFVALDTGSDLFWLPCECLACAPLGSPNFDGLPSLNVYDPTKSNASKVVTCGSNDCAATFSRCQGESIPSSGQCAYRVVYGSVNTSSSGLLYQDDIHLTPNSGADSDITSPILLGCGQTQTGSLVDGSSVPDGLLGLGLQSYSVPSVLAQSGLVGDSFSICFSLDGSGRILFGDFGSANQSSTPFEADNSEYTTYQIGVDSITVGNDSIPVNGVSLFDTGTTVTFLTSTVYEAVRDSFAQQTTAYERTVFDQLFELCYATGDANLDVPPIDFQFGGGATYSVISPFAPYYFRVNESLAGFCLAVLDGGSASIFGVNFMLGYNFVFDRQDTSLGFERSNCYSYESSAAGGSPGVSPALAPVGAPPVLAPGSSAPPLSGAVPPPPAITGGGPTSTPGATGGQGGGGQRISVPLLTVVSLGLLVNFLLH